MPEGSKCIGNKYDEIKYIIEAANCEFCLDVGHAVCAANSQGINPYTSIEKFTMLNPKRIHLSDIHIDSLFDEHLNYGQRNLDFNKLSLILNCDVKLTIETKKNSKIDLCDYKIDAEFLKKIFSL